MYKYILKRIVMMIPVLLGMTVIVFTLMYFSPGDPVEILLGTEATQGSKDALRSELGLDKPYIVQLGSYIKNVFLKFDIGTSYRSKLPVSQEILSRFPVTLRLTVNGVLIGIVLGIVAGIISAVRQYSLLDKLATTFALFGISCPAFWLALMLVLIFSINLRWLPVSGSYGFEYWILPSLTLGLQTSGIIMRMTRSSMLDVIRQDYIRTARAKGQKESVVIMRHAFRNALMPIVTVIGLQICTQLAGAVLTESVFALPGVGKYMVESINQRDYPSVQGTVLFVGVLCIFVNLIVDIVYAFIDPKIKSLYKTSKREIKT
ncbi:MAG: ABC transporter permease [Clostridiaceae bacterium]|nr:ABC transporter permease [Clostridiaceae bacterium]